MRDREAETRRGPSFRGLVPASPAASAVGRGNKKLGSRPEMLLRTSLWRLGLRYRVNDASLPGCPDIVFGRCRAVVFVDGDFWHGRHWRLRRAKLLSGNNSEYWIAKIERNRARDREVTRELRSRGWHVIRVWESDVVKHPYRTVRRVLARLEKLG